MEFAGKYAKVIMNSRKRHMTGVKITNEVVIRTLGEKETYKYLGILEADTIKQVEMKEKKKKKRVSQKKQEITRKKKQ